MTASLLNLPNEILDRIVWFLTKVWRPFHELCNISLVCKRLRQIAFGRLNHTYCNMISRVIAWILKRVAVIREEKHVVGLCERVEGELQPNYVGLRIGDALREIENVHYHDLRPINARHFTLNAKGAARLLAVLMQLPRLESLDCRAWSDFHSPLLFPSLSSTCKNLKRFVVGLSSKSFPKTNDGTYRTFFFLNACKRLNCVFQMKSET